jgi:hypothetical protein
VLELGDFTFSVFINLEYLSLVVGAPSNLDPRIKDISNCYHLRHFTLSIRPLPTTREEAAAYGPVELFRIPRTLHFLDLWQAPLPHKTIIEYGRKTTRGNVSMVWNDELWTPAEAAEVARVWEERENACVLAGGS